LFEATVSFWKDLTWPDGRKRSVLNNLSITAEYMQNVPDDYRPTDRNPRGLMIDALKLNSGYGQ
jgi:hypothetical protein